MLLRPSKQTETNVMNDHDRPLPIEVRDLVVSVLDALGYGSQALARQANNALTGTLAVKTAEVRMEFELSSQVAVRDEKYGLRLGAGIGALTGTMSSTQSSTQANRRSHAVITLQIVSVLPQDEISPPKADVGKPITKSETPQPSPPTDDRPTPTTKTPQTRQRSDPNWKAALRSPLEKLTERVSALSIDARIKTRFERDMQDALRARKLETAQARLINGILRFERRTRQLQLPEDVRLVLDALTQQLGGMEQSS